MNQVEDFANGFHWFFTGIMFLVFIVLGIRKLVGMLDEAKRFEELRAQSVMPPKIKYDSCKKQKTPVADKETPVAYKETPVADKETLVAYKEKPVAKQDLPMDTKQSVAFLRNQIILRITESPADEYELASLLFKDAASCFPSSGRSFQWDGADFVLDLKKHTLSARVSTYPNQFGASFEDKIPLSASRFHQIAVQYHMDKHLQAFRTDNDWAMLFDDKLNEAISLSCTMLQKKKQEQIATQKSRCAIILPQNSGNASPNMDIIEITLEMYQRFSSSTVLVKNENGRYRIIYAWDSNTSQDTSRHSRILSGEESVWLEKRLKEVIENPDMSLWQSLYGGDWMNIQIKQANGKEISLRTTPITKYSDFKRELENLAEYGSQKV